MTHLQDICGAASGSNIIQQQHLFSVYVHVGANEVNFTGQNCRIPVAGDVQLLAHPIRPTSLSIFCSASLSCVAALIARSTLLLHCCEGIPFRGPNLLWPVQASPSTASSTDGTSRRVCTWTGAPFPLLQPSKS